MSSVSLIGRRANLAALLVPLQELFVRCHFLVTRLARSGALA